jgi:hypothetical protein
MALTSRKARSLARDLDSFRDDRLFIVASDDTYAPKQYFDIFSLPRIKVLVIPTEDGTSAAPHVLARLNAYVEENGIGEGDEQWLLLDTDHYIEGSHAGTFIQALTEARQKNIRIALSNPCFDFWLLLHHLTDRTEIATISNASSVTAKLREILGQFNKTRLQSEHFTLAKVPMACSLARQIDETTGGGDRPLGPTSRVYQLWESLVSAAQYSQLPEELMVLTRRNQALTK